MELLTVKDITKTLSTTFTLLPVSFTVTSGQRVAIAGETGSGKSTLLKIVAGLLQPDAGSIQLKSEVIKGPEQQLISGHPSIAYLSQHHELPQSLRVEQVLSYGTHFSEAASLKLYKLCKITHVLGQRTDELSGGERQRVALVLQLLKRPQVLLLDEPYSNLDPRHKKMLKKIIDSIIDKYRIACMLVSHDPTDVLAWADNLIVLRMGRIVQTGKPKQVKRTPKNKYVANLLGKK